MTRSSNSAGGIRVLDGLDPDSDAARTVADWLVERDLVFDLVARPDTLGRWTRFVAERPRLRFVLEHSGWPHGVDEASYQAWERSLTGFARGTHAAVKVSGLAMVTRPRIWSQNRVEPMRTGATWRDSLDG